MADKNKKLKAERLPIAAIVLGCLGLVMLASSLLIISVSDLNPINVLTVAVVLYGLVSAVFGTMWIMRSFAGQSKSDIGESIFGTITLAFIQRLYMPVVICDEKGRIVWYNSALSSRFGTRGVLYGKYIDNICDSTIERIVKEEKETGVEVHFSTEISDSGNELESFLVKGFEIESKGKRYFMAAFSDITELKGVYAHIERNDTVVACAMIDNIDELVQYVQDMYGNASDDVENILRRHMERIGGVLRDYGHNKFMMLFRAEDLEKFESDRFSMLDEIREIYIGDTTIPVTISVGVAKIKGSLLEKEKTAQAALDMALQRGGDQVVVKTEDDMEYYGGKTKTVQKRTKVRSRVIANEVAMLMDKSDNVIVMGHKFADFDAFAASLAVARIAKSRGVKAYVVCDKNDKNLATCFAMLEKSGEDYGDMFVDKVEAQDLVRSGTLAIVVDVNNIAICEAPDIVNTVRDVVIIDHHRKTAEFTIKPKVVYIEPSASSASELLAEFLEQLLPQGALPKAEADLLYAGMMLDTKKFTHSVGVRTFSSALYLRGENANPLDAEALFKIGIKDFISEAKFESNVVIYKSVIAIALNENDSNSSLVRINAAKAADRMLGVEGVLATFALCKCGDTVHISARSEGKINVQLILEKMGGGGHFDSAGAQVNNTTTQQALIGLRSAIDAYFEENHSSK